MPRKRQTKTRTVACPELTSVNTKTMSQQELKGKEDQLGVLLSDFDVNVTKILQRMDKDQITMEVFIRKTFQSAMGKLPAEVKKMTMKEYAMSCAKGEAGTSVAASKKAQLEKIQNFFWKAPAESLDMIVEEKTENTSPVPVTATKGKRTARATTAKAKKGKSAMPPPSTRATRSKRVTQNTPLSRFTKDNFGQTPLFTPKFDPSLPITPAVTRDAKDGELLLSAAGSPVMISRRRAFGVGLDLKPEMVSKCSEIIEKETDIPAEERINQIFQLITQSLEQE